MKPLEEYKDKRRFTKTAEPPPETKNSPTGQLFVVQKHRASHLHYDFRLEMDGVLKSWAVPKGPSMDPSIRRLAMAVEDHPLDYAGFEGIIPEGEYGGGTVMVWDEGTYTPENDMRAGIKKGELKFTLHGTKLKGSWVLIRTRDRQWLLMKHRDKFASNDDIALTAPRSVVSHRTLAEIAADEGGNVEKAATGDPALPSVKQSKPRPVGSPKTASKSRSGKRGGKSPRRVHS
jgi:bifunctional non-homologous end joining protein LigD